LKFFRSFGINFYEGYGCTETSPLIAVNHPNASKIGTVGRPIPNVEVVLVDPNCPEIKNDKNLRWVTSAKNRRRVHRGLTKSGKKSRGLKS
jgi:long-subunit acyl-CoA synthetase (AMP-forming)